MKKDLFFKIIYLLTAVVVLFNTFSHLKESLFFDIEELPEGKLACTAVSPDGEKTVNVYLVSNALGDAVRGELVADGKTKNIFWQTGINETEAYWLNEDEVLINQMPLNITLGGDYDCRKGTSLFQEGALYEIFEPALQQ